MKTLLFAFVETKIQSILLIATFLLTIFKNIFYLCFMIEYIYTLKSAGEIFYVGRTFNPSLRYYSHYYNTVNGRKSNLCTIFKNSLIELKDVEMDIVTICSTEVAREVELFYINELNPSGNKNRKQAKMDIPSIHGDIPAISQNKCMEHVRELKKHKVYR